MPLTFTQQVAFARDALEVFVLCQIGCRVSPSLVQLAMEEVVYFTVCAYHFQQSSFYFT